MKKRNNGTLHKFKWGGRICEECGIEVRNYAAGLF